MKRKTTKMRGMRMSEATYRAVLQAAKARDVSGTSSIQPDAGQRGVGGSVD